MLGKKPAIDKQAQELKAKITKHLRTADEFFRFNRFDEALVQIDQAMKLDPKNMLARSFKERVIMMQKRHQAASGQHTQVVLTEEERNAQISRLLVSADEMIRAQDYKRALNFVAEVYKIEQNNFYAKAYSDRIEQLQLQQKQQAKQFFTQSPDEQQSPATHTDDTQSVHGAFFMYRELMKEVWFDGKVTPEEEQQLKHVRDLFSISNKEHYDIEHEVKIEAYINALRLAWRDGVLTQNERQVLELMRQKYGITSDEHIAAEAQVQDAKKGTPSRATILLVDADQDHRTNLQGFLKLRNYDVLAAGTVEQAFKMLIDQFPHAVLTEILFTSSRQDGFALFEKMRQHPTLQKIPFFFMSKLRDENVIRAALRLGLDFYFPKPVDQELLLAAIEGKLRSR